MEHHFKKSSRLEPKYCPLKRYSASVLFVCILLSLFMCNATYGQTKDIQNQDTTWITLFNGTDLSGWRGYNKDSVTSNWGMVSNELRANGQKGDLIHQMRFKDFEVVFEWKVKKGGNSGFYFHVNEGRQFTEIWRTGIEMQLMDDCNNWLGKNPLTATGSLYNLYPTAKAAGKKAGEWNHSRIKVFEGKVEYWINGCLVNQFEMWTKVWYNDRNNSIHNAERKPSWGEFGSGHFALQDEGFPVTFKNIRARHL